MHCGRIRSRRLLGKRAPGSPIALVLAPFLPPPMLLRLRAFGEVCLAGLPSITAVSIGHPGQFCEGLIFVERCGALCVKRYWERGRGCYGFCRHRQSCRTRQRRVSTRGNSKSAVARWYFGPIASSLLYLDAATNTQDLISHSVRFRRSPDRISSCNEGLMFCCWPFGCDMRKSKNLLVRPYLCHGRRRVEPICARTRTWSCSSCRAVSNQPSTDLRRTLHYFAVSAEGLGFRRSAFRETAEVSEVRSLH